MKRRAFIAGLGAAAWPVVAGAQQTTMPVVALLGIGRRAPTHLAQFRESLAALGFVEGRNVLIENHSADGEYDRLPALAAELVRRQVAVVVALTTPPALAAKSATSTIPIVFLVPDDPIKLGLAASLPRPGGNATGTNFFFSQLGAKQLDILRTLVPNARRVGLLVNPRNPNFSVVINEMKAAVFTMGAQVTIVQAAESKDIDTAFAALIESQIEALVIGTDGFFFQRRVQITTLAARHAIPAVYNAREYAEAGGLISYGTSLIEAYQQIGTYAGRILKGANPSDLPVLQSTKFEFIINLPTARALNIPVPPTLLARADEVIE